MPGKLHAQRDTSFTNTTKFGALWIGPPEDGEGSGFAVDLGPPPAYADEKKSPVVEKLRRLSFKSVTDELQQPSDNEQRERPPPKAVPDESGGEQSQRDQNSGDAVGMTNAIDRVLVASLVLCDPLFAALSA